jgi:hypothetical protein
MERISFNDFDDTAPEGVAYSNIHANPDCLTFAEMNPLPLFVSWRTENRNGNKTKVPFQPGAHRGGKANDPATWGTRAGAEAWAATAMAPTTAGPFGVGLVLGTGGVALPLGRGGIDLDSCRDPASGELEAWAVEVIERFASYTEVSPSGTGAKVFFAYDPADKAAVLEAMGTKGGKAFKREGDDHPPAIEVYIEGRYFTLTGDALPGTPDALRAVDRQTLMWLIRDAGPAFAGIAPQLPQATGHVLPFVAPVAAPKGGKDGSRSAIAMSVAREIVRDGGTYDEMCAALADDERTAEWVQTKGVANGGRQLARIWDKLIATHGEKNSNVPTIRLMAGQLPRIVDEAEAALIDAGLPIYQRSAFIVRPGHMRVAVSNDRTAEALRVLEVGNGAMTEAFSHAANWEAYDKKQQGWKAVDPPGQVVHAYRDRVGYWRLPVLAGIIAAPTLREDGSVLDAPGYDPKSGLLFDPCGASFPSIPTNPTMEDARASLAKLWALIETFPFVDASGTDRAVALSAMLTCVVRRSLRTAPMHAFTAPTAGSGKSMLVDLCSVIATGREAAVVSQGDDDTELMKGLSAMLMAGETAIAIDNCEQPLGGDFIASMLTQPTVRARILGRSEMPELPSNAFVTATGNNLVLKGDMTRRAILCRLDPGCERPELRQFGRNPIEDAKAHRGEYVAAALTVLRAYQTAGMPKQTNPLGSFGDWSRWVRDALVWLGEADPVETMNELRAADPVLENMGAVLGQWLRVVGEIHPATVKDLIDAATGTGGEDLREALLVVAGAGGAINSRRLGNWLGGIKDRRISVDAPHGQVECMVKYHGMMGGNRAWRLDVPRKPALRVV